MPSMQLQHRTSLSTAQIKEKAQGLVPKALEEFGDKISNARQEWRGNTMFFSFRAMGFSVSGEAEAQENMITIRVRLPFLAGMFKDKIEAKFKEEAEKLFS